MKPIYLIWISLLVFLVGCEPQAVSPRIPNLEDYATFDIGVNFTDHMWALAAEEPDYTGYIHDKLDLFDYQDFRSWYPFLYTHEVDYLYPQIFYFIPLSQAFDDQGDWEVYFDVWSSALENRSYELIEPYVRGLSIEQYVLDVFTEMDEATYDIRFRRQKGLLEEMGDLYVQAFGMYAEKIWPEVSQILYSKANYINEALYGLNLRADWETYTQSTFETDEIVFELSFVDHTDFDYVSLRDHQVILYYDQFPDPYEYSELISQRMGYILLKQDVDHLLSKVFSLYYPLERDYNLYKAVEDVMEFTASQYNRFILGYESSLYKDYQKQIDDFRYLVYNLPPRVQGYKQLEEDILFYLERLKDRKPYLYDNGVHYNAQVYEAILVGDHRLHYKEGFPLILESDDNFSFLSEEASVPEVSGLKMVFISPYLFEVIGNIYLYDFERANLTQLTDLAIGDQESIFKVKWLDETTLIFTKGFAYGTVTQGGTLYSLDINSGMYQPLPGLPTDPRYQVVDFTVSGEWITCDLVVYDENYRNYEEEVKKVRWTNGSNDSD